MVLVFFGTWGARFGNPWIGQWWFELLMRIIAVFIVVLSLGTPAPARADFVETWKDFLEKFQQDLEKFQQDLELCGKSPDPGKVIDGCTRLIQRGILRSGHLGDDILPFIFFTRGGAYHDKGQYDQAIGDYNEAIRLKPDDAAAFFHRGYAYSNKGQYDRAIRDYDTAIRLDPDDADVFNSRGLAKFYLARFKDAIPDLKKSAGLSPKDHFPAIWLYLSEARAGGGGQDDLGRAAENLDLKEWPGPVVSMFLRQADPKQVLAKANDTDAKKQREQRTEAYFYVGQYHLLRGLRGKAKELFKSTLELGVKDFNEYTGAQAELGRMEK